MFGKMFDIIGKLYEAKKNVEKARKRLDDTIIDAEAGGGMVKVSVTGNRKIKNISISDELLSDKELLVDYLHIALNKALEEAGKKQENELKKAATGALPNIPGLDGLL